DNDCRRSAAEFYQGALSELDGNLQRPVERENAHSVYHLYVVHVADREALLSRLGHRGVNCAIHYPIPCHLQEACQHLGYREGQFPNAEFNAAHCLSLPMFPTITRSQLEFVAETVIDEVKSEPALVQSAA
ncbi:MAG: DegT/DnrJ/EryC1/StrS family aminotransferase, partial [Verrucomicrobiota bacterium]